VKIQYPGVANSISSDLALVKPIAVRMFNLQGKDSDKYFKEVEDKLIEDKLLARNRTKSGRSLQLGEKKNLAFPNYYSEYSSEKIITMDWMDGNHLSEFKNDTVITINWTSFVGFLYVSNSYFKESTC
jgi:predicted unusual protein kinase regulating ubiquinone biosynthesis (AarF/ABC1/UbiB family)